MSQFTISDRRLRLGQFSDATSEPTLPRDADGNLDRAALAALPDDQIGTLHDELAGYVAEIRPTVKTATDLAALKPYADAVVALREIKAEREAAPPAEDIDAALAALDAQLSTPTEPETPEPEGEPVPPAADGGDTVVAPAATLSATDLAAIIAAVRGPATLTPTAPVVASIDGGDGGGALVPLPTAKLTLADRAEQVVIRPGTTITASGEVPGFTTGQELPELVDVAKALIKKRESIGSPGRFSGQDLLPVATFQAQWPDDRRLSKSDNFATLEAKINAVAGREAIVASGGLCAPVQPYYEIMTVAQASRPVRDSLASFQADRGGIRFVPPPQLVDAAGSIGFITAAVDSAALGGNGGQISAATKPCIHVSCPGVIESDLTAVTRCLEFGNFTARAYPEQVVAWMSLAMAQQARKGEVALIDGIATASTQVTAARVVGAARDVVAGIVKAAAYYRNHNRMDVRTSLRVLLPAWVIDLMIADLTHGSGYELEFFSMARTEIEDSLAEIDINVTFYLDSGTGKGQYFNSGAVQAAGALTAFPSTVVWYLFAEGSFLFLDGGTLDLGIVRDSGLNALNNYRMFAESFEAVAFVGVESLEVTQTVVADGTYAGPAYGSTTVSSPVAFPTAY